MNEIETWHDIPDYAGYYMLSTLGRVRSLPRFIDNGNGGHVSKEKILHPQKNLQGYLFIMFSKEGKTRTLRINRLVAHTFHGLDLNDKNHLALHKNDIRDDNAKDNIFVGTYSDNVQDCMQKGRGNKARGENAGKAKLTEKQVKEIRSTFTGARGERALFGKRYGVSYVNISCIIAGRSWVNI